MKLILSLFILFLLYDSYILAQQEFNSTVDTIPRFKGIIPPMEIKPGLDDMFLSYRIDHFQLAESLYDESSTIWLQTGISLSNPIFSDSGAFLDNHFTHILYQKHLEDSRFDPVRYVLGMAQLSAVAYLAYRHIKKYGFWK